MYTRLRCRLEEIVTNSKRERKNIMKVKETAKKPYGICPASMTIWNADQTYNKKGILGSYALRNNMFDVALCC